MNDETTDEFLKRRKYPRVLKGKKRWKCDRCQRDITPGESYEHSFSPESLDLHLCLTCSMEV